MNPAIKDNIHDGRWKLAVPMMNNTNLFDSVNNDRKYQVFHERKLF